MIPQAWSWVLLGAGLLTHWLAGSERASAWVVGLVSQVLWVVYGATTDQLGFVLSAVLYAVVHVRNLRRARRKRSVQPTPQAETT